MSEILKLKTCIGQEAEQIIAKGLNLDKRGKKYRCPNGLAHKNGDKNPSMSWDPKSMSMHCFTCGFRMDIYDYLRKQEGLSHNEIMLRYGLSNFNRRKDDPLMKKEVKMKDEKDFKTNGLTRDQMDYLKNRGLSEGFIGVFGLADATYPNTEGNIAIPYRDRNDKKTGIKVRMINNSTPKYLAYPGSKFGFFNKQYVDEKERSRLIITEGEFDCMILCQLGYLNVVSVGCGANALKSLLQEEAGLVNEFASLIILADNDSAGNKMVKEFSNRFGMKVKVPDLKLYKDNKDITEVFINEGEMSLRKLVDSATIKVAGWRDLDTEPYKGLEWLAKGRYIPTGIPSIDHALNDLGSGLVTIITGRANAGKSCYVNAITANAIDKGNKVLLMAGEGNTEMLINNFYKAVVGNAKQYFKLIPLNKRYFLEVKKEYLYAIKQWHKGKLSMFNKGESKLKTIDEFFEFLKGCVKEKQPNLVIIDNLMSWLSVEKASEKLERQADFMQRCCDLAKSENIHLILVVHPNKTLLRQQDIEFEHISGSADLYNKADNVIGITRYYDDDKIEDLGNGAIMVLKNRLFPDIVKIFIRYNRATGMLEEIDKSNRMQTVSYSFNWKRFLNNNY